MESIPPWMRTSFGRQSIQRGTRLIRATGTGLREPPRTPSPDAKIAKMSWPLGLAPLAAMGWQTPSTIDRSPLALVVGAAEGYGRRLMRRAAVLLALVLVVGST